jgi:hypothetical protein
MSSIKEGVKRITGTTRSQGRQMKPTTDVTSTTYGKEEMVVWLQAVLDGAFKNVEYLQSTTYLFSCLR